MPLPTIDLDDRRFEDLLDEALSLVPAHAPDWTNHNVSDPGVTLLELFAWLAEMLVYRANRIPDAHRIAFLRLLNGPEWTPTADLERETEQALLRLRSRWRAVTCEDYEELTREVSPNIARVECVPRRNLLTGREADSPGDVSILVLAGTRPSVVVRDGGGRLRDYTNRARSEEGKAFALLPSTSAELYVGSAEPFFGVGFQLDPPGAGYAIEVDYWDGREWTALGADDGLVDATKGLTADGVVSFAAPPADWAETKVAGAVRYWLRFVTANAPSQAAQALRVTPDDRLLTRIDDHLEERRILGTAHHVLEPEYVPVAVEMTLVRRPDVPVEAVKELAVDAIEAFLDAITGGPDRGGWPFGRPVFVSELHELLHALPEIDHVADLRLSSAPASKWLFAVELLHDNGDQIGVDVGAHRLPEADVDAAAIQVVDRTLVVRVAVDVQASAAAAPADAARAVKDAVRTLFAAPFTADRVVEPGTLQKPISDALGALGSVVDIVLESDPVRTRRDELIDAITVRVRAGELVEPATFVRWVE
jgi:hypothetical protein